MYTKLILLGSILLVTLPTVSQANTVHKWVDESGKTHYSDQSPQSRQDTAETVKKVVIVNKTNISSTQKDSDANNDNGNYNEDKSPDTSNQK